GCSEPCSGPTWGSTAATATPRRSRTARPEAGPPPGGNTAAVTEAGGGGGAPAPPRPCGRWRPPGRPAPCRPSPAPGSRPPRGRSAGTCRRPGTGRAARGRCPAGRPGSPRGAPAPAAAPASATSRTDPEVLPPGPTGPLATGCAARPAGDVPPAGGPASG